MRGGAARQDVEERSVAGKAINCPDWQTTKNDGLPHGGMADTVPVITQTWY
jgi:hypothetical protein